jgi:hypothetical protein
VARELGEENIDVTDGGSEVPVIPTAEGCERGDVRTIGSGEEAKKRIRVKRAKAGTEGWGGPHGGEE